MAGEWPTTTIGEQATLQRGIDITKAEQTEGSIPVISSGGVSSYHNVPTATGPGVILGRKGVVGSVWFVSGDYWPHDTTLWVKDFHGNERRFVYYFFKWFAPRLARMDVGSANPTLNRNHVHPIEVRWPPVPEQRAIAHILGTLDDKIELNRRMSETLEAMARALFKSWFVDFDPVRAKAEGRDPDLPPDLAALFPDRLVESELGEIPEGWEVRHLEEIACLHRAALLPGKEPDRIFEHYSIPAHDNRQEPSLDRGETIKSNKTVVPNGAVLLSKLNPNIRRVWLPKTASQYTQVTSTEFLCFTAQPPAGRAFLYCLFQSEPFRRELGAMVTGTSNSHQRVSPSSLLGQPVCAGDVKIYEAFERQAWPMLERTISCRADSHTLAALRDSLLPKLISGELRVKEAEEFVGRAV